MGNEISFDHGERLMRLLRKRLKGIYLCRKQDDTMTVSEIYKTINTGAFALPAGATLQPSETGSGYKAAGYILHYPNAPFANSVDLDFYEHSSDKGLFMKVYVKIGGARLSFDIEDDADRYSYAYMPCFVPMIVNYVDEFARQVPEHLDRYRKQDEITKKNAIKRERIKKLRVNTLEDCIDKVCGDLHLRYRLRRMQKRTDLIVRLDERTELRMEILHSRVEEILPELAGIISGYLDLHRRQKSRVLIENI